MRNVKLKVYNKSKKAPKPNQPILPGVCAVILNKKKQILLHKRSDSDFWALPGGTMETGESISQCCSREISEEMGLEVKIEKLVGIYTSPNCVFEWVVGKKSKTWQIFVVAFLCKAKNDRLNLNFESTEASWFSEKEIEKLKTLPYVKEAIENALHKKDSFFD